MKMNLRLTPAGRMDLTVEAVKIAEEDEDVARALLEAKMKRIEGEISRKRKEKGASSCAEADFGEENLVVFKFEGLVTLHY